MAFLDRFRKKSFTERTFTPINIAAFGNMNGLKHRFRNPGAMLTAYFMVPQLRAIIDYAAANFSSVPFNVFQENQKGETVRVENEIYKLFQDPHPLLSSSEFFEAFYKQWQIFGNVVVFKNKPAGFTNGAVKSLFILPFQNLQIIVKDKVDYLRVTDITEIIDKYILTVNGKQINIDPEDIWHITNSTASDNFIVGDSVISSLEMPLNTIINAYEAQHTILAKRGALGILSNESKSADLGHIPMRKGDKEAVQESFRKYGLNSNDYQIIIADAALRWQPMSMPIKELEINENIQNAKVALCDAYRFPILLLNELSGSTYSNLDTAHKQLYTNKIIPEWHLVENSINREFDLNQNNEFFSFDYSDVPALQIDEKAKAETNFIESDIIIKINQAIQTGAITPEIAQNMLILLTGISEEDAKKLINNAISK